MWCRFKLFHLQYFVSKLFCCVLFYVEFFIDPDVVVSIFTGVNEQININNSYNYLGYSYGPWYNFNYNTSTTQGTLYIDIIDYKKNELVWQGIGKGYISEKTSKKEEQIKSFVNKILLQYPVK